MTPKPKPSKHGIRECVQTDVVIRATVTKPDGIAYYGASFVRVTIGVKIGVKMNNKLKPCPFCGSKRIDIASNGKVYVCYCTNCKASTNTAAREEDAIYLWNKRAEPERKNGEWIKVGHWGRSYKCNQCGNYLDFDGVNAGRGDANFCPNCGTDMRGKNEKA